MRTNRCLVTGLSKLPAALLPVLLLCAGLAAGAGESDELRARAIEAYDAGRYADALPLLEQLDESGAADGTLLYRLYYCQRQAGDGAARSTLDRARTALEAEVDSSASLEAPFYLANALRNVGRISDARQVAAEATARVESGALPTPETGTEKFQLGKLYADQERSDEAARWYAEAMALLADETGATSRPYLEWAGRYLVERAWADDDYEAAALHLTLLTAGDDATGQDLDRLAVAQSRLGHFAEAKTAWQRMERIDRGNADRPRYCWRLAATADELGGLPELAPDGRGWAELTKEELEALMADNAQVARDVVAEATEAEKLKKKQRKKMDQQLAQAREVFTAAALEYALRGHQIREAAFFGGYAPLIFHARQWKLPQG